MAPRNESSDVVKAISKWPPIIQLAIIVMLASGSGGVIGNNFFLFRGDKLKTEVEALTRSGEALSKEVESLAKKVKTLEEQGLETQRILQQIQLDMRDLQRRLESKGVIFKPKADYRSFAGDLLIVEQ